MDQPFKNAFHNLSWLATKNNCRDQGICIKNSLYQDFPGPLFLQYAWISFSISSSFKASFMVCVSLRRQKYLFHLFLRSIYMQAASPINSDRDHDFSLALTIRGKDARYCMDIIEKEGGN
jgi:hypothetical protein